MARTVAGRFYKLQHVNDWGVDGWFLATPPAFRDLLLSIAKAAGGEE